MLDRYLDKTKFRADQNGFIDVDKYFRKITRCWRWQFYIGLICRDCQKWFIGHNVVSEFPEPGRDGSLCYRFP